MATYHWPYEKRVRKRACAFRNATCTATLNLVLGGTPMQARPKAVRSRSDIARDKQYSHGLKPSTTQRTNTKYKGLLQNYR